MNGLGFGIDFNRFPLRDGSKEEHGVQLADLIGARNGRFNMRHVLFCPKRREFQYWFFFFFQWLLSCLLMADNSINNNS